MTENAEPKLYLVFRRDLNLTVGKAAVMGAHAVGCVGADALNAMRDGTPVIAVGCDDEMELLALMGEAVANDDWVVGIRDAGRTTIPAGTLVCAAIWPVTHGEPGPMLKAARLL